MTSGGDGAFGMTSGGDGAFGMTGERQLPVVISDQRPATASTGTTGDGSGQLPVTSGQQRQR